MLQQKYYRGDICFANLNPVKGSEQGGERPVIIIQNDRGNQYSPTVIVAVITHRYRKKSHIPTHVLLESRVMNKESQVLLEQIRTLDKTRIINKIGRATKTDLKRINKALVNSLDLRETLKK